MKTVAIVVFVLGVLFLLMIMACCKASGDYDRQLEKEKHCYTCLRWEKCNGEDKDCPRRNG